MGFNSKGTMILLPRTIVFFCFSFFFFVVWYATFFQNRVTIGLYVGEERTALPTPTTLCIRKEPNTTSVTTESNILIPTLLRHKEAVCLSGVPASYYFAPGSGDGVDNWVIYLPGRGWCENTKACINYISKLGINKKPPPLPETTEFDGILSNDIMKNPDFYNWNKVEITSCDGSSLTGDSEQIYNDTKLYFKGAKIFKYAMEELLQRGMKSAKNVLLAGDSAGAVATMIHCDRFRHLFSNSTRVKCLSDGGYFFLPKKYSRGHTNSFTYIFQGLINLHESTNILSKSCTAKLSPDTCYFADNVQDNIQTPIFFLMSQFDFIQIGFAANSRAYEVCVKFKNCSATQIEVMQDLRLELLNILSRNSNYLTRGFLSYAKFGHTRIHRPLWYRPIGGIEKTVAELFGDWFFDRRTVQIIDKCDNPYGCN